MKKRYLLLNLFSMLFVSPAPAQENINQFDQNGKKHGKWEVYLNENWKEVPNKTRAAFMRYTVYDHGENIYPMKVYPKIYFRLEESSSVKEEGKIKILDGDYKWFDKKGRLISTYQFNNGESILHKNYFARRLYGYKSIGQLRESYIYTKHWKAQPNTYCIEIYDKNGNTSYYFMRKGVKGWAGYQASKDEMQ